jgi:kynurenine formamidase
VNIFATFILTSGLAAASIDTSKLVDLTYSFDEHTVYWPTASPFRWKKEAWGPSAAGFWYAAGHYQASEHGGTHLDAPIHFGKGQLALDEIPVERLVGPAAVIDVTARCTGNPDYLLSPEDIAAWEKTHGRIRAGTTVLVRTGWGKYWPDRKRYLGSDTPGDIANLHFPGISRAAAEVLVERRIAGAGIDTASLDHGPSKDFAAHQVLNGAGIYGLENIANLERVPPVGATLVSLPMKIKGGSGGPVRIVAILP